MTDPYLPRHPSLDLFTRLSNVQMELWKRRDRATNMAEHQDACVEIDDFIQTTSEICDIAISAAGINHNTETPTTDGEHLNKILTLTTLDYYLSQIGAVLSSIDISARIDGLYQGVEGLVGRSQHLRHLISSSLQELRGGA
ncbi:MAG: hypothetical protein Q9215_004285 [Flavoplaca cf. flavocitrina]